ncbi:hypothetical protein, partial [Burkholderia pseudomallei]|uniref:hypothetical protein n=1 Tax=Burkholderia pseudomallei TaxID=28450 RepID=UPI001AD68DAE|nr:hypothetical protein [Burkholderia pseudomallei]
QIKSLFGTAPHPPILDRCGHLKPFSYQLTLRHRADLLAAMNEPLVGVHSRCARGAAGMCSTTVA